MRPSLPPAYLDFFRSHHCLEIQNLVLPSHLEALESLTSDISGESNGELWLDGKKKAQSNIDLLKILHKMALGEIAHQIFQKRPLRLGSAQFLLTKSYSDPLFKEPQTIEKINALTPILGGASICIRSSHKQSSEIPQLDLQTPGHIIFFNETYPLDFEKLLSQEHLTLLIVCFVPRYVRYKYTALDPIVHHLKKEGFAFGDLLPETICPYLYR